MDMTNKNLQELGRLQEEIYLDKNETDKRENEKTRCIVLSSYQASPGTQM